MLSRAVSSLSLAAIAVDHAPTRKIFTNIRPPAAMFLPTGESIQAPFPSNEIRTSKYTVLSFLPHNLFEQFRRFANIFFLLLAILQFFPAYQSINPWVAALPLILVITATCAKDAFEDYRRHTSDLALNTQTTLRPAKWRNTNKPFMKPLPTVTSQLSYWVKQICFAFGIRKLGHVDHDYPRHGQIEPGNALNDDQSDHISSPVTPSPSTSLPLTPSHSTQNSFQPSDWSKVQWKNIQVGDIIMLQNNEHTPADLVVLASSEPEGLCYAETKNLDGETNLKIRKVVSQSLAIDSSQSLRQLRFVIECEKPHPSIYSFTGTLINYVGRPLILPISPPTIKQTKTLSYSAPPELESYDASSQMRFNVPTPVTRRSSPVICASNSSTSHSQHRLDTPADEEPVMIRRLPISVDSMLLRGCVLRNTGWVYGVVVYTGPETKISLNSGGTPIKRSFIEVQTNRYILMSLGLMVVLSLILSFVGYTMEVTAYNNQSPWLDLTFSRGAVTFAEAFSMFWVAIILFQNLVPISLYITVEVVKSIQDIELYDASCNEPCIPRSWNLADDLGQIEYIFSDKTGTLTRNIMEFKRCSVNSVVYGAPPTDATLEHISNVDLEDIHVEGLPMAQKEISPFSVAQLEADLHAFPTTSVHYKCVYEFFSCLSLCHTVLVSTLEDTGDVVYKAQSPDEAALVGAAKLAGFVFRSRDNTTVEVDMLGTLETFQVLNVIEFTSSRKRMSVILRRKSGEIVLYCKGADSVIFDRLAPKQTEIKIKTMSDLEGFAEDGLRTLCLAYTLISESAYSEWEKEYHAASIALNNREDCIEKAADLIERDLLLLGATAIEDKLQEECQHAEMHLIVIRGGNSEDDQGSTLRQMQEAISRFFCQPAQSELGHHDTLRDAPVPSGYVADNSTPTIPLQNLGSESIQNQRRFGLVMDGRALFHALDDSAKNTLVDLAIRCDVVICCRVSPLQKAKVVQLIKTTQNVMCLSIGDGANDVSMIQAAHVGIGISGQEGLQAAMAADFVISQFRFLERLLLVHGRWCYVRTASMILNFLFKNLIYTVPLFVYQLYCGFSAQPAYDPVYMILANILFTAIPVAVLGAFDKDVSADIACRFPRLYYMGIVQEILSNGQVLYFALEAVYQGVVIIGIQILTISDVAIFSNGRTEDSVYLSVTLAICCLCMSNFFIGFSTHSWTWLSFVAIYGTNILVFVFLFIYMRAPGTIWPLSDLIIFSSPLFWLSFVLSITVCSLPKFTYLVFSRLISPTDIAIVQEYQSLLKEGSYVHSTPENLSPDLTSSNSISRKRMSQTSDILLARTKSNGTDYVKSRRRSQRLPSITLQLHEEGFHFPNSSEDRALTHLTTMNESPVVRDHGFSFSHSPGARSSIAQRASIYEPIEIIPDVSR
ncbi:hypothetical protein BASA50_004446 [Batrachochytrium salamandrivorans]|uniref:Phospholipid-transporting ATPase n=1 Tax=Batrachochytrium salamandrivorans TaxID=1357716 RepID=A0ABQ8FG38_9FUNG|nr:hypothetical protein BASA50_004446 [Batrachochytrium salamandrivorans]